MYRKSACLPVFSLSIIKIKLEYNMKKSHKKKNHQADNRIIVVCCVFVMDGGLKRKPGLNAGKISTGLRSYRPAVS